MRLCKCVIYLLIFMLLSATACSATSSAVPTATGIPVTRFEGSTAFETFYPVGWVANIAAQGIIVFSPPEVIAMAGEGGPSVTLYREDPRIRLETLETMLEDFLARGALQGGFILVTEFAPDEIGQYEALSVQIHRDAGEDLMEMTGMIWVCEVDSKAIYYTIATAPADQWNTQFPNILSVVQSIEFHE